MTGYTMLIIPADGSPITEEPLGAGDTQFTHNTGGNVICYLLLVNGTNAQTDAVCGYPNASMGLGGAALVAGRTDDVLERVRAVNVMVPR